MNVSSTEQIRTSAASKGPYVKYLVRRETHSSRAVASILVALLLIVALVYVAIEGVLSLCGEPKLLARPEEMWQAFTQIVSSDVRGIVTAVSVALIILGLLMLGKAFLPGMLGRHSINDNRAAYIVDDGVIASNVSRLVREEASVPSGQVTTSVAARSVDVAITPTTGYRIDQSSISQTVQETVGALELHPKPRTHLKISEEGKVAK